MTTSSHVAPAAATPLAALTPASAAATPTLVASAVTPAATSAAVAALAASIVGWSKVLPGLCISLLGALTLGSGSISVASFEQPDPESHPDNNYGFCLC